MTPQIDRFQSGLRYVVVALAVLWVTPQAAAQQTTLTAVAVATRGQEAVITISATGPLPDPSAGVLAAPPRIYFDFPNVRPRAAGAAASSDPRIRRVRVALHTSMPPVTRVVVDLTAPQTYRIERTPSALNVIVGERPGAPATAPAAPPVPPAPPVVPTPTAAPAPAPPAPRAFGSARSGIPPVPSLPPVASPASPAAATPSPQPAVQPSAGPPPQLLPPKDLERYRKQVATVLDRLRMQEPLLKSLDVSEEQTVDRMQLAADEFERLRQELTTIKPPDTLRAQHAMLVQSSTLAIMAATLRMEAIRVGDVNIRKNAASAAAGALLLLQRACGDLRCN